MLLSFERPAAAGVPGRRSSFSADLENCTVNPTKRVPDLLANRVRRNVSVEFIRCRLKSLERAA